MSQTAPKSLRLHIGIYGRANAGKSSLLNLLAGQDVSITSEIPGTTTDVVEKPMELLPIGPVVFLDTAGLGDKSVLGEKRIGRTQKAFDRTDVALLVADGSDWGEFEENVLDEFKSRGTPVIIVANKSDLAPPSDRLLQRAEEGGIDVIRCCANDHQRREILLAEIKRGLLAVCPDDFVTPPPLMADLVHPGGIAVLIVPIDLQAPKGRLILPQVSTIRDCLDNDAIAITVKEREYAHLLSIIRSAPDLAVCDSQVVMKMVADTPDNIPCTTFSILFARLKGDLPALAAGAAAIDSLRDGDRVLVSESCSHHALEDDIGRVKIPRWIRQYSGAELKIEVLSGRDFPDDLGAYSLVIQCGGCMHNRREMLSRIERATAAGVPITNYGICISHTQGVLKRVLSPFPAALDAYKRAAEMGEE